MLKRLWAGRDIVWLSRSEWRANAGAPGLARLLAQASEVICLAGITAPPGAFDLNKAIGVAAAEAAPGDATVLLMSTMAVYGAHPGPHGEDGPAEPSAPYGVSKREMEQAVSGFENVTCLRLSNVIGADQLGANISSGAPITIDAFPDGRSPARSYIDPVSLGAVYDGLFALVRNGANVPKVLNVARPPVLEMAEIARAAGAAFRTSAAPDGALRRAEMDCARLFDLLPDMALPVRADAAVAAWRSVAA